MGATVLACVSFPVDQPSAVHDIARAFRGGDPDAFERVVELVGDVLAAGVPGLAAGRSVTGVAVPRHHPREANLPCERLLDRLAARFAWLVPAPGALVRVAPAPEGKVTADGSRNPGAEAATLAWSALPVEGPVLLLDDVVRTGATFEAAILAAPDGLAERIVALAVFRAVVGDGGDAPQGS